MLKSSNLLRSEWNEEPHLVPPGTVPQVTERASIRCNAWQSLTGDAGWAGVMAESFLSDSQRQVYLIFEPGMDLLSLIDEAIGLLPPEKRWDVTFSTYFATLPQNAKCLWRCVLKDSAEANGSRRFVRALRLDLTQPLGAASGGELVEAARTGERPKPKHETATVSAPQERTIHFEDSEAGTAPYQIREGAAAGSQPSRRPPVRRGATTDNEAGPFSTSAKLTLSALVLLVLVSGAAGLVTLFSPDQKEDQRVAQNEKDEQQETRPENVLQGPKPAPKQNESQGLPPLTAPKPFQPLIAEKPQQHAPRPPAGNSQNLSASTTESEPNKPQNEKVPEPQGPIVVYRDLPQVGDEAARDLAGASSGEKTWDKPVGIPLNLPEGMAITDFDFHLLKTDKENFGERSRIDKSQDGGVVVEVRDPIQTDRFNSVGIISRDENRLSFQYKVSPRRIPDIPGFLERGLLEVDLDSKEQRYVAFKEPRVLREPIASAEPSKSPSSLTQGQATPLSWEVNIADKEVPAEYLSGIVLNDIVIKSTGGQWSFFRNAQSGQLVLENNKHELDSLYSSVDKVAAKMKKAGHKYKNKPLVLQTKNKSVAGNVLLEFDAIAHAEGITRMLFEEMTGGVRSARKWVMDGGKPYIQSNPVPASASLSFDELQDEKRAGDYQEYIIKLQELLKAMEENIPQEKQQKDESAEENIKKGIADLTMSAGILPELQAMSEQIQSLHKEFENAQIIQLTASRTFHVPDPDGKEPKPVHIKILELKPADPKPKEEQKKEKK